MLRIAAPIAVAACLLGAAPSALAATRHVAPSGSDGGNCVASACASLGYAYGQSGSGDVVRVAAGSYPAQNVPAGSKAVTFSGAPGAKLRELDNTASNVVFDGIEVDVKFAQAAGFENHDAANVIFRNGRIGNVTDEKGALVSGRNFTFDRVTFHDVRATNSSVHNECVYAIVVPGMTVRNSFFRSCATMDLFFTFGHWWTPLPSAYGGITLENNVFSHTYKDDGTWHYYSLFVGDLAPGGGGPLTNWVVRNNTFEIPAAVQHSSSSGSRWVGNLGSWDCVPGMKYSRNVGEKCTSSDKAVSPHSSTASVPAPFGWVAPQQLDFRLKASSLAVSAADPADAPATDLRGWARDSRPDAGAYEYGKGGTSGKPRIRRARLRPRVICKRHRRGCRSFARLRFRVSEPSQVSIRVRRLRKGGRSRLARKRQVNAFGKAKLRIRTRGLRPGRYRVLLVATDVTGLRSVRKRLRLRVVR